MLWRITIFPSLIARRRGVPGLDEVLQGGLPRENVYLVHGDPGVGKTTLALQFLLAGTHIGERALYITLTESRNELLSVAQSHGRNPLR